jgi:hypothetical protein
MTAEERTNLLNLLLDPEEKLYKIPPKDAAKWFSFEDVLHASFEPEGVKFKFVQGFLTAEERWMLSEIQDLFKANGIEEDFFKYVKEGRVITKVLVEAEGVQKGVYVLQADLHGRAGVVYEIPTRVGKVGLLLVDIKRMPTLQHLTMTLRHEFDHVVTNIFETSEPLRDYLKVEYGEKHIMLTEALAVEGEGEFADWQHKGLKKAGLKWNGFDWVKTSEYLERLRSATRTVSAYSKAGALATALREKLGRDFLAGLRTEKLYLRKLKLHVYLDKILGHFEKTKQLTPLSEMVKIELAFIRDIGFIVEEVHTEVLRDRPSERMLKIYRDNLLDLGVKLQDYEMDATTKRTLNKIIQDVQEELWRFDEFEKEGKIPEFKKAAIEKIAEANSKLRTIRSDAQYKIAKSLYTSKSAGLKIPEGNAKIIGEKMASLAEVHKEISQLKKSPHLRVPLETISKAKNSLFRGKVPEALLEPFKTLRKSPVAGLAAGFGMMSVFVLGPEFVKYGEAKNNPFYMSLGHKIEKAALSLMIVSAGLGFLQWVGVPLGVLSGLALTKAALISGAIVGIYAIALVQLGIWIYKTELFLDDKGMLEVGALGACDNALVIWEYGLPKWQKSIVESATTLYRTDPDGYKWIHIDDCIEVEANGKIIGCEIGGETIPVAMLYDQDCGQPDPCGGDMNIHLTKEEIVQCIDIEKPRAVEWVNEYGKPGWLYLYGPGEYKRLRVAFIPKTAAPLINIEIATETGWLCQRTQEWSGESEIELGTILDCKYQPPV